MTDITMVSGTAKEVSALILADVRSGRMSRNDAIRQLRRAERREWARDGKLTSSSSFPHRVALGVDMVETNSIYSLEVLDTVSPFFNSPKNLIQVFVVSPSLKSALEHTATSGHELWFSPEDGSAFISFEDHDDAVMFELALVGDRS